MKWSKVKKTDGESERELTGGGEGGGESRITKKIEVEDDQREMVPQSKIMLKPKLLFKK